MKTQVNCHRYVFLLFFLLLTVGAKAETFYWRGITSSSWTTSSNWHIKLSNGTFQAPANGAYPRDNDDVIIGDIGFIGSSNPEIGSLNSLTTLTVKSLTIGLETTASLVVTKAAFTVNGSVTIGEFGTLENKGTTANYKGDFTIRENGILYGRYKETSLADNNGNTADNKELPTTIFSGNGTIKVHSSGDLKIRSFGNLVVNGTINLESDINIIESVILWANGPNANTPSLLVYPNVKVNASGVINPGVYRVIFQTTSYYRYVNETNPITLVPQFSIQSGGIIKVRVSTYKENYSHWPTSIQTNGTIEYVAPAVAPNTRLSSAYSQTIYAPTGSETAVPYKNLKLSGGGVRDMSGSILVEEEINLESGRIETGDSDKITLGNTSGRIRLENEANYITGTVETSRPLTVGTVRTFGNTGITITSQVDGGLTKITRVTGKPIKDVAGVTEPNKRSILRYYTVEPAANNGSLDAIIQLRYLDHELNGFNKAALIGFFSELFWDETAWNPYWNVTQQPEANQVTLTKIRSLGRYTLGVGSPNPFPVEMIYFTAAKKGSDAVLNWAVASEENNSGFEVQASTDGKDFQKIGFVKSRVGTTSIQQEYSFTDSRANKYGTIYYRLKQIDLDGKATIYGPREVNFGTVTATAVTAYPNPITDNLKVKVTSPQAGGAKLTIHDMMGKVWVEQKHQVEAGSTALEVNITDDLPAGIYVLTVILNEEVQTFKLMKE